MKKLSLITLFIIIFLFWYTSLNNVYAVLDYSCTQITNCQVCNCIKVNCEIEENGHKDCETECTCTVWKPTNTPTPTKTPTPTPIGPTNTPSPTPNPNCTCASNLCASVCTFDKYTDATYSAQISCAKLDDTRYPTPPTAAQKDDYCQRPLRTKGDANGNGIVTLADFFYWVAANYSPIKIHANITADFNGDGATNASDAAIIIKTLKTVF